jgi:hypothetical protein
MKSSGIWVYVVGILMFVWGFCQLGYAFMDFALPITIPFTDWGKLLGEKDLFDDVQFLNTEARRTSNSYANSVSPAQ